MKNIFRVIGFGLAVVAFSAVSGFAQNPCDDTFEVKNAEYQKFRENIKAPLTVEKLKIAQTTGNNFVTRYKDCGADLEPIIKYINGKMPAIKDELFRLEVTEPFNNAVKAENWNVAFDRGKAYIAEKANDPSSLDVAIVLATIGYDRAVDKVDTFNNDAMTMAKMAIQKIKSGVISKKYGEFGKYEFKTKENALGWMNYIIGYISYVRQDKKKDALPYLYAVATGGTSDPKGYTELFTMLGAYYYDEALKIDVKRLEAIKINGDKDNDETLAMWALEKGYLDRTLDAYARAHDLATKNVAKAEPAKKAAATDYKNKIYGELQRIYKIRFDKTDGLDPYLADLMKKPLPDPSTEVTPVKEETPATTTTTSSTTTNTSTTNSTTKTTNSTTTNTNTTTKPTNTTTNPSTTTKPTTNTTTKPSSSTTKPKTTKKKTSR